MTAREIISDLSDQEYEQFLKTVQSTKRDLDVGDDPESPIILKEALITTGDDFLDQIRAWGFTPVPTTEAGGPAAAKTNDFTAVKANKNPANR